jgi:hypothetical protein
VKVAPRKPDYDGARVWVREWCRMWREELASKYTHEPLSAEVDADQEVATLQRAMLALTKDDPHQVHRPAVELLEARIAEIKERRLPRGYKVRDMLVVRMLQSLHQFFSIPPTRNRARESETPCGIELVIDAMRAENTPAISYAAAEKAWRNRATAAA